MAFSFMDISKIKTEGQLTSKYNHNCRTIQIDNVIPELTEKNETLIALPIQSGKQLNYNEAFKERIESLDYYKNHKIRANAVLGYEVLLTFSRDADLDLESWKKQSVEWLHKTFDVAPDNKSNVLHAEFHADEVGNVHIHAFVVPIDERGRLNAKRFTDGSRVMSELQSSYAESVSDLGLQRGIAGSSAKHKDIRRMYANLNNALKLPEVLKQETANQYRDRVVDNIKTALAAQMRESDDYAINVRRELDIQKRKQQEEIERELNKKKKVQEFEDKQAMREKEKLQREMLGYEQMVRILHEQLDDVKAEVSEAQKRLQAEADNENAIEFYKNFQAGMDALYQSDPERAADAQDEMDYICQLGMEEREEMQEETEPDVQDAEADL